MMSADFDIRHVAYKEMHYYCVVNYKSLDFWKGNKEMDR